jgi:hypothetical protein
MGLRSSPLPFWIAVFVLFPGGPQRGESLGPGVTVAASSGVTVGVTVGDRVVRAVTGASPVGGIYLLNLGSVGAARLAGSSGSAAASDGSGPSGEREPSGGRRWPGSSGSSAGSGRSTGTPHLPELAPNFGYVSPWATVQGRHGFKSRGLTPDPAGFRCRSRALSPSPRGPCWRRLLACG